MTKPCAANDILEVYFDLYNRINTESLTPEDVIDVQETILYCLEQVKILKKSKQACGLFAWDDFEYYLRSLVNNILCIFFYGGDIYEIAKHSTNTKKYSSVDPILIREYIEICREMIQEDENAYIVITDLCVGNIESGDVIVKNDEGLSFIEIKKDTPKNNEIMKALEKGENCFNEEKDIKQYNRLKRQNDRNNRILKRLEQELIIDDAFDNYKSIGMPLLIEGIDTYADVLIKNTRNAESRIYNKAVIDDAVTIEVINQAALLAYYSVYAPECIKKHTYNYYKNCYMNDDLIRRCERCIEDDSENRFVYNDCIDLPYAPKPFLYGFSLEDYKHLFYRDVIIYITIDFEILFKKMRENGVKVYKEKLGEKRMEFKYKNHYWVVEKDGKKSYLGNAIIDRIAYGLYTTDDYIKMEKLFWSYNECRRYSH